MRTEVIGQEGGEESQGTQVITHPKLFLQRLFTVLLTNAVDVSGLALDHLCYRVETPERYEALRKLMSLKGVMLAETMIEGRSITTYRMHRPWLFNDRIIDVLE